MDAAPTQSRYSRRIRGARGGWSVKRDQSEFRRSHYARHNELGAREGAGTSVAQPVESYPLTMSAQQERFQTYSWRVISRLKLAVMQLPCTDIDRLRSRALFQSRKFPNRVCPSLRDDDYERYVRRRPMDTAATAGIYQFPPISEPVIDASSPLPLPRIIDISRRSCRDLVLDYDMKFFTDGGTLSFSPLSIFLIPFPFLSPFSRTEITIMYWRSKMMKGRKI